MIAHYHMQVHRMGKSMLLTYIADISGLSDLYISCQLWTDGKEYTMPFRTPWKEFNKSYTWNHVITLPIPYNALLLSSQLSFTIWDVRGPGRPVPVGGSTMSLFTSKRYVLREKELMVGH